MVPGGQGDSSCLCPPLDGVLEGFLQPGKAARGCGWRAASFSYPSKIWSALKIAETLPNPLCLNNVKDLTESIESKFQGLMKKDCLAW